VAQKRGETKTHDYRMIAEYVLRSLFGHISAQLFSFKGETFDIKIANFFPSFYSERAPSANYRGPLKIMIHSDVLKLNNNCLYI
jgi:hypothetical protein